ncbi:MAG: hypothetical protein GXC73_18290 [Chitinophagaceae bacterium]|nr:hypothetical protein [Chitinophagaceae bacterium]
MIIFTTDEPLTNRRFFISILLQLIFMLLFFVVFHFAANSEKAGTAYLIFGILFLGNIISLLQLSKLEEIRFDEEKKELHFYSKRYFSKLRKVKTSFEGLSVRRKNDRLKITKGRKKVFTISCNDDVFSIEKMNNIIAAFKANNIPVE